jgi:hypothetical protein
MRFTKAHPAFAFGGWKSLTHGSPGWTGQNSQPLLQDFCRTIFTMAHSPWRKIGLVLKESRFGNAFNRRSMELPR